jgi:hypothetical protein
MFLAQLIKVRLLLCFALGFSAYAASAAESSLNVRGFGTLGVAKSSSPYVEFIRDLSQPKGIDSGKWSPDIDTLFGIQANWRFNDNFEIVTQIVSRYRYNDSRDPVIDWAFLKWEPDDRISLRIGRIGADTMMLADSRLVGYSSLTVRPSVDFFGPLFFSSFDGIDASITLPLGNGLIQSKAFGGLVSEKVSGAPGIWDTSGSPFYGLVIDYFAGSWQFRANTSNVKLSNNLNFTSLTEPLYSAAAFTSITSASIAADALTAKDTNTRYYSLGVVYDNGPIQIQAAANKITHETATFQNSNSGYVLGGYRINTLTPYIGVSRWISKYKDYTTGLPDIPLFAPLNEGYQMLMDASTANQTTYTMGLRWDVWPQIALKFQWDAIRGKEASTFPYAKAISDVNWKGRTDVASVSMDFIF